jgi:ribose 5-phosphate isomerase B
MNLLVLGARVVGPELALEIIRAFVGARFTAEDRHLRRLGKLKQLEQRHGKPIQPKEKV